MTPGAPVLAFGGTPLRRIVLAVFVGAWLVRLLFLSVPDPLSLDEHWALKASEFSTASKFMDTADWGERWRMLEQLRTANGFIQSTSRVLWTLAHVTWGYLFPSNGQMAYAFTQASALIAMLALAGAARRLYGQRGFLFCLLVASLSPLFLNYTVRVLATMPSTMWICLVLFFFTSPQWTARNWAAGGLCLGLAFAIHYGSGVAIVAIGLGLGLSVSRLVRRGGVLLKAKLCQGAVCPATGAIAGLVPLVTLEAWSRHAGSSYMRSVYSHANLYFQEVGPYGLWLRELFELDPLLQVLLCVALAYAFRSQSVSRPQKTALMIGSVLLLGVLVISTDHAPARAIVSLGLFFLIGALVHATRLLERDFLAKRSSRDDIPEAPAHAAPFTRRSLGLAIVVAALLFSVWRQVSSMPRGVFPAWPLFVLGLLGSMLRLMPDAYHALLRGTALLGSLLFLLGAGATYHAKSAHVRADAYWARQPHLKRFAYEDFWDVSRAGARLSRRTKYEVSVIGPPARLYPASAYEEEPYKILLFRRMLRDFGLEGVLSAEEIPYAYVFFEEAQPEAERLPPPGAS